MDFPTLRSNRQGYSGLPRLGLGGQPIFLGNREIGLGGKAYVCVVGVRIVWVGVRGEIWLGD
jgi:hypothetical protein